jgi:CheY-like chemotaxis protein
MAPAKDFERYGLFSTPASACHRMRWRKPMILKGWKDIANYLRCGVRTVQRWERLGMPVRRPAKHKHSAVVAITKDIDEWLKRPSPTSDDSVSSHATTGVTGSFRHRILLADDNESHLIALAARLADEAYDVRTARDGFEALAVMRDGMPDVLVSDLRMPNMSGFELFSIVRRRFPSVAAIAYTAEFVPAGKPSVLCDRFIMKGRNSGFELRDAIRQLLSQSPMRSQPAKMLPAPVWIPRSVNGYFVLICLDCLRSFSVLTRDGVIGEDAITKCFHCAADVTYHIDDSVLPIKDDLTELRRYSSKDIGSTQGIARGSRRRVATQRSGRPVRS